MGNKESMESKGDYSEYLGKNGKIRRAARTSNSHKGRKGTYVDKGITTSLRTKERESCLFCRIIHRIEPMGAPLYYRDDHVCIFSPNQGDGYFHYLVCPVSHVDSLLTMCPKDTVLLQYMWYVASRFLLQMHVEEGGSMELGRKRSGFLWQGDPPPKPEYPKYLDALKAQMFGKIDSKAEPISAYGNIPTYAYEEYANAQSIVEGAPMRSPPPPVGSRYCQFAGIKFKSAAALNKSLRMCFHVPPFNTINHLHMHLIIPPFRNPFKEKAFDKNMRFCDSIRAACRRVLQQTNNAKYVYTIDGVPVGTKKRGKEWDIVAVSSAEPPILEEVDYETPPQSRLVRQRSSSGDSPKKEEKGRARSDSDDTSKHKAQDHNAKTMRKTIEAQCKGSKRGTSIDGSWRCQRCSAVNPEQFKLCEVCRQPK